jgi:hypothetical protein
MLWTVIITWIFLIFAAGYFSLGRINGAVRCRSSLGTGSLELLTFQGSFKALRSLTPTTRAEENVRCVDGV